MPPDIHQIKKLAEKISAGKLFVWGAVLTAFGAVLAFFHSQPISAYADMFWGLGIALIIPFLILTTTDRILKKLDTFPNKPPDSLFLDAIKNMNLKFFRFGITLYEIHNDTKFYIAILDKIRCAKKPMTFRFLLLRPYSRFMRAREKEQNEKKFALSEKAWSTIVTLHKIKEAMISFDIKNVKFECRIYDDMPTLSLFLVDNKLFIGPYLPKNFGYKTPWVEIPAGEDETRCKYRTTFKKLWHDSEDVDLSQEGIDCLEKKLETEKIESERLEALLQQITKK